MWLRAGFTLLEILIGLTIAAGLVLVVATMSRNIFNSYHDETVRNASNSELDTLLNLIRSDLKAASPRAGYSPSPLTATAFPKVATNCPTIDHAQCNGLAVWIENAPGSVAAPTLVEYNTRCTDSATGEAIDYTTVPAIYSDQNRAVNGGITCNAKTEKPIFVRSVWNQLNQAGFPPAPDLVPPLLSAWPLGQSTTGAVPPPNDPVGHHPQQIFPTSAAIGSAVCFKFLTSSSACPPTGPATNLTVEASEIFRAADGNFLVNKKKMTFPLARPASFGITILK